VPPHRGYRTRLSETNAERASHEARSLTVASSRSRFSAASTLRRIASSAAMLLCTATSLLMRAVSAARDRCCT